MANDAAVSIALRMVDQATGPMQTAMRQIEQNTAAVERQMRGLQLSSASAAFSIDALYANMLRFGGLVGAGGALAVFYRQSEQAAASVFQTKAVFKDMADDIIARSKDMARAVNHAYSQFDIQYAFRKIHDSLERYGLDLQKQQQLIERTMDVAASRGLRLGESIDRIESAMRGEAEASEYLGLTLNETYMKTTAFDGALGDVWEKLTESEKARLRYVELMEQTAKYTGSAATATETLGQTWTATWNRLWDESGDDINAINSALATMVKHLTSIMAETGAGVLHLSDKPASEHPLMLAGLFGKIASWLNSPSKPFFDSTDLYQNSGTSTEVEDVAEQIAEDLSAGIASGVSEVPEIVSEIVNNAEHRISEADESITRKREQETEKRLRLAEREAAANQRILESVESFLSVHTLADDSARRVERLHQQYARLEEQIFDLADAGVITAEQYDAYMEQWQIALNNDLALMEEKHEKTTGSIEKMWDQAYRNLQDITADWIYNMEFSLDSLKDFFKRTISQMVAAWMWGQGQMAFAGVGITGGGTAAGAASGMSGAGGGIGYAGQGATALLTGGLTSLGYSAQTMPINVASWIGEQFANIGFESGSNFMSGIVQALASNTWLSGGLTFGIGGFLMTGLLTGDWNQAAITGGLAGVGAAIGTALGPLGTAIGGILGSITGSLFGGKEKAPRVQLFHGLEDLQWTPSGWVYGTQQPTKTGYQFGDATWQTEGFSEKIGDFSYGYGKYGASTEDAEALAAEVESGIMDVLDSYGTLFEAMLQGVDESLRPAFEAKLSAITNDWAMSERTHASSDGEIDDSFIKQMSIDVWNQYQPVLSEMLTERIQAVAETWTGTINLLTEETINDLSAIVGDLPQLGQVSSKEELEAMLQDLNISDAQIAQIEAYLAAVNEITDAVELAVEQHGMSDFSRQVSEINTRFLTWHSQLVALGVDTEKFTALLELWELTMEDLGRSMASAIHQERIRLGYISEDSMTVSGFASKYGLGSDFDESAFARMLEALDNSDPQVWAAVEKYLKQFGLDLDDLNNDLPLVSKHIRQMADSAEESAASALEAAEATREAARAFEELAARTAESIRDIQAQYRQIGMSQIEIIEDNLATLGAQYGTTLSSSYADWEQFAADAISYVNIAFGGNWQAWAESAGVDLEQFYNDYIHWGNLTVAHAEALYNNSASITASTSNISSSMDTISDVMERWVQIHEDILGQMEDMLLGPESPLSSSARLENVWQRIGALTGGLAGGELQSWLSTLDPSVAQEIVTELKDLWGTYLGISQEMYDRPSIEYQDIWQTVMSALQTLADFAANPTGYVPLPTSQPTSQIFSYASGISYVPRDQLALLHKGEEVVPAHMAGKRGGSIAFNLSVNVQESKDPRRTAREIEDCFISSVRSGRVRRVLQEELRYN